MGRGLSGRLWDLDRGPAKCRDVSGMGRELSGRLWDETTGRHKSSAKQHQVVGEMGAHGGSRGGGTITTFYCYALTVEGRDTQQITLMS